MERLDETDPTRVDAMHHFLVNGREKIALTDTVTAHPATQGVHARAVTVDALPKLRRGHAWSDAPPELRGQSLLVFWRI